MKNPLPSLLGFSGLKKKPPQLEQGSGLPVGVCRQFSLAEIKAATSNFQPNSIISEGGLVTVYKGTIDDGTIVAVKRYRSLVRVFKNEVQLLCQLRHPNLVSLIGVCLGQNEMFLVLEYVNGGSFYAFLHREYVPLAWKHRLHICIGAARGLHYLHTGAKRAVIHRDIKSSNMLLDDEFSCKLADFGLSKLAPRTVSKALIRTDTFVTGTLGYVAPEYLRSGELTEKSDVFSFGVVLFEVLCGTRVYDRTLPKHERYILGWASKLVKEGTIYHVIDPYLQGRIAPECLKKYLEIACGCLHYEGNERPTMGEVEVTLELALELQEQADSEMKAINPCGECMY